MKPFVETNLEELCEQVDVAERAWKAAVIAAQKAATPQEQLQRDIEVERKWRTYWPLKTRYLTAVRDFAAEEEQNDPEGIQNHPDGPEVINP